MKRILGLLVLLVLSSGCASLPGWVPGVKPFESNACFLQHYPGYLDSNCLAQDFPDAMWNGMLNAQKGDGYDELWAALSPGNEAGPDQITFYSGAWGTSAVDKGKVKYMVDRLKKGRSEGFRWSFIVFNDDAPQITGKPISVLKSHIDKCVENFDGYAERWVLGIECPEYWNAATIKALTAHLKSKTNRPVGLHFAGGQYASAKALGAEFLAYQVAGWIQAGYGSGLVPAKVAAEVAAVRAKCGLPVYCMEYAIGGRGKAVGKKVWEGGKVIGTGGGR